MSKRKALATKNAPRRVPLTFFAVVWLLLDRAQAPGWLYGVVGTFCAVLLVAALVDLFTAEEVVLPGGE